MDRHLKIRSRVGSLFSFIFIEILCQKKHLQIRYYELLTQNEEQYLNFNMMRF